MYLPFLFQMLHRLLRVRVAPVVRALSSVAWREKLTQGPSLKSFIEQTATQIPHESISPPYLTQQIDGVDDEPFDAMQHRKRRVYFDVYGCQMNENDTDIAYTFLDKHGGYERVNDENDADIVL